MVGIGFCKECHIRIFLDEKEGQDYYKKGKELICADCMDELNHKESDNNE